MKRTQVKELKKLIWMIAFLLAFVASTSFVGCSKTEGQGPPEKKAETESRVKRGTNGEVVLTLDIKTQEVMGLQTATLRAVQLSPEIKGYGRVMDVSALAAMAGE